MTATAVKPKTSGRREKLFAWEETPAAIGQDAGRDWVLYHGDCVEVLSRLPEHSFHLAVFSPPFSSLYTYSASERDMGNTRDLREFIRHFRFLIQQLRRVMKPGRNVCVHVSDIRASHITHGWRGIINFSDRVAKAFTREGFTYHSRITIDKNPQAQATRNKVHELMFVTKERDASMLAPTLPDYILVFRAPGQNAIPIPDPIDDDTWIEWAHPIWYGIRETDVLNAALAKAEQDERHLCPLQLPVIDRCVRLWSNPGEVVLSPFGGIGSEGVGALRAGRKAVLVELKASYFQVAARNLRQVEADTRPLDLFSEETGNGA